LGVKNGSLFIVWRFRKRVEWKTAVPLRLDVIFSIDVLHRPVVQSLDKVIQCIEFV